MKSKLNPVPAAKRTEEIINTTQRNDIILKREEAQKLVTGIYEFDAKVKSKDSQIVTITKQKNDLQQLVTSKTSEIQSKNSLLVQKDNLINQKTTELQSKDSLLLQKEQLLSELRIKEENQLKEEYISVLHQLNPKVFSANYEDWSGKAQGFKDIIDQGKFKTIRKKLPVYKQQLAQKIETEKLALATKEAERLDNAKQEVVSILNQLHPTLYPANFEEWSTHPAAQNSRGKELLDSNNLGAIEKKLVHYRELLKQEVQNKALLILQKEQEFKSLNDTFTIKEEEIITKSQLLSQSNTKVKKVSRKLAQEVQSKNQLALQKELEKEEIRIQKEQEIERLRELLAQKDIEIQNKDLLRDELLTQKELENQEKERLREELARKELEKQELLIQKEREKEELLVLKENELREKEELLAQKGLEINNLANSLLTKEEEIVSKDLKIGEVSQKVKKVTRKLAAKDSLLNDKEQRIEELKMLIEQSKIEKEELLAQQELALANKSHMKNQIIDELRGEVNLKENEVVDLRLQNLEKELIVEQKEKLLIQKELELADKSFVKNQVIEETEKLLSEQDIRLQNILDLNAKLDAKIQYSAKEIKIREAEKEVLSKIINQKNDQLKYLLIEKENAVDNKSFEKNQVIKQLREEIIDLNKQLLEHDQHITHSVFLDEVGCQPGSSLFEKQLLESLNLSSINLSPINHGEQNQIVGNILGNFDIENQHVTHSVLLGGEGSESFEIIHQESFN